MSESSQFTAAANRIVEDPEHRRIMTRNTRNHRDAVSARIASQYRDWQAGRAHAAAVKAATLDRLPELLEQFETNFTARGGQVLWAADAAEARAQVLAIVRRRQAKLVVKSKSMMTEEIELNDALEAAGLRVLESDLGEYIVQLAGQKPYHIVTPAMHMTHQQIAELFHEKLGSELSLSAAELTMVARQHLREVFTTADVGITGGNFLVADAGAVAVVENEGNGRLSMSCPPVHIAIVGIEKMVPRLADLAFFLPHLVTSGTGQQVSCYASLVRGPRQPGEVDGPEETIVILVDNRRSELYARGEPFREILRCIRCGSCLNACPVYRLVGGHAYNTPYMGPVGAVLTPHLRGFRAWAHMCHASSLCGACTFDCPMRIDLHHLLLANRDLDAREYGNRFWRWAMRLWAWGVGSRRRQDFLRRFGRWTRPLLPVPKRLGKRIPQLAPRSFAQLWRDDEQS